MVLLPPFTIWQGFNNPLEVFHPMPLMAKLVAVSISAHPVHRYFLRYLGRYPQRVGDQTDVLLQSFPRRAIAKVRVPLRHGVIRLLSAHCNQRQI